MTSSRFVHPFRPAVATGKVVLWWVAFVAGTFLPPVRVFAASAFNEHHCALEWDTCHALILSHADAALREIAAHGNTRLPGISLETISDVQARAGDIPAALRTVAMIPSGPRHDNALTWIITLQAGLPDVPGAFATAESITDPIYKDQAIRFISEMQSKAGDFQGARRTARRVQISVDRRELLVDIAQRQAQAGDVLGGFRALRRIRLPAPAPTAWDLGAPDAYNLARDQANKGDLLAALRTADDNHGRYRAALYGDIVNALARRGDFDGARRELARVWHEHGEPEKWLSNWPDRLATEITQEQIFSQARAGDVPAAVRAVAGLPSADRPAALGLIAAVQAWTGDLAAAEQTLALPPGEDHPMGRFSLAWTHAAASKQPSVAPTQTENQAAAGLSFAWHLVMGSSGWHP